MQEWGADVIKVELPGFGDQSRWLPISREDRRSAFFAAYNRGKRSVTVDLRVPAGREVFLRLVERADVVITNFKPGTMESWGLGYADAAARNRADHLRHGVLVRSRGPRRRPGRSRPQRAGGRRAHQHDRWPRERTPRRSARPSPTTSRARTSSPGILAALYARERTGRGPADRDLAARRPDLGAGRRVHRGTSCPGRSRVRAAAATR